MKKKILWFVVVLSVLAFAFLFQDIPVHKQNDSIAYEEIQAPAPETEEIQFQEESESENVGKENLPEEIPSALDEQTEIVEEKNLCTIEIICSDVFNNMELLEAGKVDIIPTEGIILSKTEVEFFEDETVFNVLSRETKRRKIHIDFVYTPMYNSVYIKGIGNLYEKDCGATSGWLYKVNGETPSCGSSQYTIKKGDEIQWFYSCKLGGKNE